MSKFNLGSINYTKLKEAAAKKHSAFSFGKDGKTVYVNIIQWENDQEDQYGNTSSLQLNSTKEKRDAEGKVYIGNMKSGTSKTTSAAKEDDDSSLPF